MERSKNIFIFYSFPLQLVKVTIYNSSATQI